MVSRYNKIIGVRNLYALIAYCAKEVQPPHSMMLGENILKAMIRKFHVTHSRMSLVELQETRSRSPVQLSSRTPNQASSCQQSIAHGSISILPSRSICVFKLSLTSIHLHIDPGSSSVLLACIQGRVAVEALSGRIVRIEAPVSLDSPNLGGGFRV